MDDLPGRPERRLHHLGGDPEVVSLRSVTQRVVG